MKLISPCIAKQGYYFFFNNFIEYSDSILRLHAGCLNEKEFCPTVIFQLPLQLYRQSVGFDLANQKVQFPKFAYE